MNEFNLRFEGLDEAEKQARYLRLAEACLAHYDLPERTITFVAHNAGVVYRVEAAGQKFLLKIEKPTGEVEWQLDPEPLRAGYAWLDALAREAGLTVQQPIANLQGAFLTVVEFEDLSEPFFCSLQRWLDGEHPRDPLPDQAYQIGAMMARLHTHGSGWIQGKSPAAWEYGLTRLHDDFERFARVRSLDIITEAEWTNVTNAVARIEQVMQGAPKQPIHGDIHQGNLLVVDGEMCPIDFGGLLLGHPGCDLGLTLYHLMYLDAPTRQALVAGYRSNRALTVTAMELEAFLCMSALANLAFNVELPDQRASRLFIRNVREFAAIFCHNLINDIPFALEPYDYIR